MHLRSTTALAATLALCSCSAQLPWSAPVPGGSPTGSPAHQGVARELLEAAPQEVVASVHYRRTPGTDAVLREIAQALAPSDANEETTAETAELLRSLVRADVLLAETPDQSPLSALFFVQKGCVAFVLESEPGSSLAAYFERASASPMTEYEDGRFTAWMPECAEVESLRDAAAIRTASDAIAQGRTLTLTARGSSPVLREEGFWDELVEDALSEVPGSDPAVVRRLHEGILGTNLAAIARENRALVATLDIGTDDVWVWQVASNAGSAASAALLRDAVVGSARAKALLLSSTIGIDVRDGSAGQLVDVEIRYVDANLSVLASTIDLPTAALTLAATELGHLLPGLPGSGVRAADAQRTNDIRTLEYSIELAALESVGGTYPPADPDDALNGEAKSGGSGLVGEHIARPVTPPELGEVYCYGTNEDRSAMWIGAWLAGEGRVLSSDSTLPFTTDPTASDFTTALHCSALEAPGWTFVPVQEGPWGAAEPLEEPAAVDPAAEVDVAPGSYDPLGDADAPVTIVMFTDLECPFCKRFHEETLPEITATYGTSGDVRVFFRHFPLAFHEDAQGAAEAAACAAAQGKLWEMLDTIFEHQEQLAEADFESYAGALGLDREAFGTCLTGRETRADVERDLREGEAAGVSGTPTFFVNGTRLVGAQPYESFERAIEDALTAAR